MAELVRRRSRDQVKMSYVASSPRRQLEVSSVGFLAETRWPYLLHIGLRWWHDHGYSHMLGTGLGPEHQGAVHRRALTPPFRAGGAKVSTPVGMTRSGQLQVSRAHLLAGTRGARLGRHQTQPIVLTLISTGVASRARLYCIAHGIDCVVRGHLNTDLAGVQGRVVLGDASTCAALVRTGSEFCEWRRVAPSRAVAQTPLSLSRRSIWEELVSTAHWSRGFGRRRSQRVLVEELHAEPPHLLHVRSTLRRLFR